MNRTIKYLLLLVFGLTILLGDLLSCQVAYANELSLPKPGSMVMLSKEYTQPVLKGIKINPSDPFNLEFVVDTVSDTDVSKEQVSTLVSYFMAALAIDKKDIWVNLSPYEKDRITDDNLAITDLGKDLLQQDYILKQLSASLTHPETPLGKTYWNTVGTTFMPSANLQPSLDKIWIVPEEAFVYEEGNTAYITKLTFDVQTQSEKEKASSLVHILNKVKEDVNSGANFSQLRQMFHSIVLAEWFKEKLKDSLFNEYINKNNVSGIDIQDKNIKDKIWEQYVESFNIGAYDMVAKVRNVNNGQIQKKKYFCGGIGSSTLQIMKDNSKDNVIVGKAKIASVEILESKKIFRRLIDSTLKFSRNIKLSLDMQSSRSAYDFIGQCLKYVELNDIQSLRAFAQKALANNLSSELDGIRKALAYDYSREYLFDNLDDIYKLLREFRISNVYSRYFDKPFFNVITASSIWTKIDIKNYRPVDLVDAAKVISENKGNYIIIYESYVDGVKKLSYVLSEKEITSTANNVAIYKPVLPTADRFIRQESIPYAGSAIEAQTAFIAVGILTIALLTYEIFLKGHFDKNKLSRAEDIFYKLASHDYDTDLNVGTDSFEVYDLKRKYLELKKYAMIHAVSVISEKSDKSNEFKIARMMIHMMQNDYHWHDFEEALNDKNDYRSPYCALFVLHNKLKQEKKEHLDYVLNIRGIDSEHVVKRIKNMRNDSNKIISKFAKDIINDFFPHEASSSLFVNNAGGIKTASLDIQSQGTQISLDNISEFDFSNLSFIVTQISELKNSLYP